MTALASSPVSSPSGARLVDPEGRALPLRGTRVRVRAGAGLARVHLEQTFENPHEEPLRVRYQLPLPADGAVVGFGFVLDGERIEGRVEPRAKARADFERALLEGRSAALLEQDRSSLFNQEIGNLPPGAELRVEVDVDQPLAWIDGGAWAWRFPTVVGPRYLGAPGRTPDAERVEVPVAAPHGTIDARAELELHIDDALTGAPRSPSHPIVAEAGRVGFAAEAGAELDRDIVVEWTVAAAEPGAELAAGRPLAAHPGAGSAYAQLTLVPPVRPGPAVPRDLVFLVDVSGSMHGEPLEQAKRCLLGLVDRLGERDRLEMVAFASRPERWRRAPVPMDARGRRAAAAWLRKLSSAGATEMRAGIEAALEPLRDGALRQVVLVTDGYIGFEAEIVAAVKERLPRSCRVHVLGVGSGVNRSLTGPVARAGAGLELIVEPGEDAERHAGRLLAATDQPLVTELELDGEALLEVGREALPDLMGGAPARLPVRLRPEGGRLEIRGRTVDGPWRLSLEAPSLEPGEGPRAPIAAFARERVEELEMARAAAGAEVEAIDAAIERLGVDFRISTRHTSWVAVRAQPTVDPRDPTRSETMPHLLPRGVSAEGVGLRAHAHAHALAAMPASPMPMDLEPLSDLSMADAGYASLGDESLAQSLTYASPPPASEGAPRARSLFGGLGDKRSKKREGRGPASSGGAAGRPPELPTDQLLQELLQEPRGPVARLVARVRLAEGGRLVLEVLVGPDGLEWSPPSAARVDDGDGREAEVEVLLDATTAAGSLAPGATLRLVLGTETIPREVRVGDLVLEVREV